MDFDTRSDALFGRYQALRVYAAIASCAKPEFSTGKIARLANVDGPRCSKELARLAKLGLVTAVSRRGDYVRNGETCFWRFAAELAEEWASMADVPSGTESKPE